MLSACLLTTTLGYLRLYMQKPWFKHYRVGIFAAYYPARDAGWVVTLSALVLLVFFFRIAEATAPSVADVFGVFAPKAIIILLIFDIISFRTGEYPKWWKKHSN